MTTVNNVSGLAGLFLVTATIAACGGGGGSDTRNPPVNQDPSVSLAAVPGRRVATLELAGEIEKRGFTGIYCPSMSDGMVLCEALAFATNEIPFGTSIAPIYTRPVLDHAMLGAGRCHGTSR